MTSSANSYGERYRAVKLLERKTWVVLVSGNVYNKKNDETAERLVGFTKPCRMAQRPERSV